MQGMVAQGNEKEINGGVEGWMSSTNAKQWFLSMFIVLQNMLFRIPGD